MAKKIADPATVSVNDTVALLKAFDHYEAQNPSVEYRRACVRDYMKKYSIDGEIDDAPEEYFLRPLPYLCRMEFVGVELPEKHHLFIRNKIDLIKKKSQENVASKAERKEKIASVVEKVKVNADSILKSILPIIKDGGSVYEYLKKNAVGPRYTRQVIELLKKKKSIDVPAAIGECEAWIAENKKPRKPRKKKEKSVQDITKHMRFKESHGKLVGKSPESLVGAKGAILYHTGNGTVFVYRASSGLVVNRATLKEFDDNSFSVKVSKKQEDLLIKCSQVTGRVSLERIVKVDLESFEKCGSLTGRTNEYMIVLAAF